MHKKQECQFGVIVERGNDKIERIERQQQLLQQQQKSATGMQTIKQSIEWENANAVVVAIKMRDNQHAEMLNSS